MPEISIVLPVYNVSQYLNACLDSIAAQTFQDWEAIVVDDGSTDFSGIICDSYSRKDHRFRVIHQENQGVSSARNAGIDAATAQLLAFVDPDDFVSENFFSCLVGDLSANGAECAVSSFCNVHENGKEGIHEIQNRIEREAKCRFPHVMSTNEDVIDALCGNHFESKAVCFNCKNLGGSQREGQGVNDPLFSAVELEKIAVEAAEAQREFDAWVAQLQTPAAKTEAAALAQEAMSVWEAFVQDCRAGK